jgi:hypothetical protein
MKGILRSELGISSQNFTQEALDLFDIVKQKLEELRIAPDEAKEYFHQFVEKLQRVGLVPPLIINLLRDIDNNYQTLIISKNLSAEEEMIIAACVKPQIIGTNEIIPQTENKELTTVQKEVNPYANSINPFSDILTEIFYEVLNLTHGNKKFAREFTDKTLSALEKISRVPHLPAINGKLKITPLMLEQPHLQVNPTGIRAYLQKQEDKIMLSADKSQHRLK